MKIFDKKYSLAKQLIIIVGITFFLLFLSLGIILPRLLIPIAESNIYSYLREPLNVYNNDSTNEIQNSEIAFIYIYNDNIIASKNITDVIKTKNLNKIINKMDDDYGKFNFNHKTYYYYTLKKDNIKKIAIANNYYINETKEEILKAIFPTLLGTFLLISLTLFFWSTIVIHKIDKLKEKIDNYRNQMYQNISHDFKTPLTVIKSYIEAVEDGVEDNATALATIKEQTNKLEQKVHSLLYLNKLDYLKNSKNINMDQIDMEKVIHSEVEKFKFTRKEITFVVKIDNKSKFYGSIENWETILDNLLSNFMRYAKNTIKITAKQNKLILYNDGENIDNDFLEAIFTPFRKGIKGQFGLGLSIVKKTLNLMEYDITIKNEKKGVSFIITQEKRS